VTSVVALIADWFPMSNALAAYLALNSANSSSGVACCRFRGYRDSVLREAGVVQITDFLQQRIAIYPTPSGTATLPG
jgi:hypothetical protein